MEEGINKKIEEYEYQIKLMSIFQNFLIDITKKLEIKELAENLLKFLNESFKIDKCSVIINRQRYFLGNLKDEKLIESENRIMKEVYKVSIPYIVKNLKNDTILFDLKNDSEESLLVIPIINDNKIITYVDIYDQPENIHKKDVKLINYFLSKINYAIINSLEYTQVKDKSITDSLTGLYNRNYFIEKLRYESRNFKKYLSIIMTDIDYFKNYNDKNGHKAGDYLLKELAVLLKNNFRTNDIIGRYGGEEFIIILPETDNETGLQVCERLRKSVESYNFKFKENQPNNAVTISIGLMTTVSKEIEVEDLIKEADNNLYKSKTNGRNRATNSIIISKNLSVK